MSKFNLFESIKPYGWLLIFPVIYLAYNNNQLSNERIDCQNLLSACQAELEECRADVLPPSTATYLEAKTYIEHYNSNNTSGYAAAFQVSTEMIRSLYANMVTIPTIAGYRGYYGLNEGIDPTKEFVIFRGIDSGNSEIGNANSTFIKFSHEISSSHDIISMYYNPCPKYCDRSPGDGQREDPGWQ